MRKLSAICLAVQLCRLAITSNIRPPGVCGEGKSPCPNGAYQTTAIPFSVQYGNKRRSIPLLPK